MDYFKIRRQLLKAMRGPRSQLELSRQLGFSFNQVHRWESGLKTLPWPDFCRLCAACGLDLAAALKKIVYHGDPADAAALFKSYLHSTTPSAAADSLKVSRHRLSRWLRGESAPNLEEVLALIDKYALLLSLFVDTLVGPDRVAGVSAKRAEADRQRALHYEEPAVGAILRCLELQGVRTDAALAHAAGMSPARVREVLTKLRRAGLVERAGDFFRTRPEARRLDTRGPLVEWFKIPVYWFDRLRVLVDGSRDKKADGGLIGYRVFCTTDDTHKKLRERTAAYYNDVSALISSDTSGAEANKVWVLFLALSQLNEVPESRSRS